MVKLVYMTRMILHIERMFILVVITETEYLLCHYHVSWQFCEPWNQIRSNIAQFYQTSVVRNHKIHGAVLSYQLIAVEFLSLNSNDESQEFKVIMKIPGSIACLKLYFPFYRLWRSTSWIFTWMRFKWQKSRQKGRSISVLSRNTSHTAERKY